MFANFTVSARKQPGDRSTRKKKVCLLLGSVLVVYCGARTGAQLLQCQRNEFDYLARLIRACGALCRVDSGSFRESLYFNQRTVPVDCTAVFSDQVFILQGHGRREAPRGIPTPYHNDFTLNNRIPVVSFYFDQKYLTKTAQTPVWKKQIVDNWVELARRGKLDGNYGKDETSHLMNALKYAQGLKGGRALVIGSENPWVEATVLAAGAKEVLTLEYGNIRSEHPAIETVTPSKFKEQYQSGTVGVFDVIVTFSSVEHSGLGRYGDALNPWGDVLEIARAHCVCKTNGSLVIAVMTKVKREVDAIEFNAHRTYGPIRWPYLASNWRQVHREPDGKQRVYVFVKIDPQ